MSYSRWSNSFWYTYWLAQPDSFAEDRLTATFQICPSGRGPFLDFKAHEIRTDIESCLNRVRQEYPDASAVQMEELSGYMKRFVADVDEQYPRFRAKKRVTRGR